MTSARSYLGYMFLQRGRDDEVGRLALDAFADRNWVGTQFDLKVKTRDTRQEDAFLKSVRDYGRWAASFREAAAAKKKEEAKASTHAD
jgi:hypothetical protein